MAQSQQEALQAAAATPREELRRLPQLQLTGDCLPPATSPWPFTHVRPPGLVGVPGHGLQSAVRPPRL